MELNREQIIKALECISRTEDVLCAGCDYRKYDGLTCHRIGAKNALTLIKELTEENERLRAENEKYEAENHAEFNKWLKLEEATKQRHHELFEEAKIVVKADTVKKMQTEIEARCIKGGIYPAFVKSTLDQIVKEMLNEETH